MEPDARCRVRKRSAALPWMTTPRRRPASSAVRMRTSSTKHRWRTVQVHRRGDGSAARSGRRSTHVAPGGLREGLNGRGLQGPLFRSGCRVAATHMSWAHVHAGSTPATRTIFLALRDLWRGSGVGQYERLITSRRRCKSCPRNQTFLGLLPCRSSPVTGKIVYDAAQMRRYPVSTKLNNSQNEGAESAAPAL